MASKTYKRRDSAVAVLRKHGIPKEDYDLYLAKDKEHNFILVGFDPDNPPDLTDIDMVSTVEPTENGITDDTQTIQAKISKAKQTKAKPPKSKKKNAKPKPTKKDKVTSTKQRREKQVNKDSISGAILNLINAGKSNAEIWESIKIKFKLDESKKWYPGWYRSYFRRKAERLTNGVPWSE